MSALVIAGFAAGIAAAAFTGRPRRSRARGRASTRRRRHLPVRTRRSKRSARVVVAPAPRVFVPRVQVVPETDVGLENSAPAYAPAIDAAISWVAKGDAVLDGHLVQLREGDMALGVSRNPERRSIVYLALYNAAYDAAELAGDPNPGAFAERVAGSATHRMAYLELIQCAPFNDRTYGSYELGHNSVVSAVGRAVPFEPVHADNLGRILQGLPVMRTVEMGSPGTMKSSRARTGHMELLWLPRLNREALYAAGAVTTEGMTWEDASSCLEVPPAVLALGDVGVPASMKFGCPAFQKDEG